LSTLRFPRALTALIVLPLLGPASAAATSLQTVGEYASPVHVTSDPGDPNRLFVVEQDGRIRRTQGGATTTFLNIDSIVRSSGEPGAGGEQGLLSMAFSPDYETNGLFYVFYTGEDDGTTGANESGALHIDEFDADQGGALATTRSEVIEILHKGSAQNHNGGQLHFGQDGYLYASTGDGGTGGANAQELSNLLGKIVRIDTSPGAPGDYSVPPDNPFAGDGSCGDGECDEIWSYGLRNPWRFSFDRLDGSLVIGDVGQKDWEEVDYEPAAAGLGKADNFGWRCREGLHPFNTTDPECVAPPTFTEPVFEYPHNGACSITGGFVARDPALGNLFGRYLYADLCSGEIRSLRLGLPLPSGDRSEGLAVGAPTSFGQDACGRIYVASHQGPVYRLAGAAPATCSPAAPLIADTDPDSPTSDRRPEVKGVVGSGDPTQIDLYKNASCSGPPDASGSVTQFTGAGITVEVAEDATTRLSARARDGAGNTSGCSNSISFVEDSTPPAAPTIRRTVPASPANDRNPEVRGTVGAGDPTQVKLHTSATCAGAGATGTVAQFTGAGITLRVANGATTNISARALDQAGNKSACSNSIAYTELP
jgi:glucose/arabinose dehydrogenase